MADRYWVGGTNTWNATAGTKWSATSGGAGGASVPTSTDNVFFNASSGSGTVTVANTTGVANCANLDLTGFTGTLATTVQTTLALSVYGNLTIGSGATVSGCSLQFLGTGVQTVTLNGKTIGNLTLFPAGTTDIVRFVGTVRCTDLMLIRGIADFDTNDVDVIMSGRLATDLSGYTSGLTRQLLLGTGLWSFTHSTAVPGGTSSGTSSTATVELCSSPSVTSLSSGLTVTNGSTWRLKFTPANAGGVAVIHAPTVTVDDVTFDGYQGLWVNAGLNIDGDLTWNPAEDGCELVSQQMASETFHQQVTIANFIQTGTRPFLMRSNNSSSNRGFIVESDNLTIQKAAMRSVKTTGGAKLRVRNGLDLGGNVGIEFFDDLAAFGAMA